MRLGPTRANSGVPQYDERGAPLPAATRPRPDGTLVAGGKEAENVRAVWSTLDHVKTRHADVILVHGGGPGTEKIAAS